MEMCHEILCKSWFTIHYTLEPTKKVSFKEIENTSFIWKKKVKLPGLAYDLSKKFKSFSSPPKKKLAQKTIANVVQILSVLTFHVDNISLNYFSWNK